jgi:hypothetical protein
MPADGGQAESKVQYEVALRTGMFLELCILFEFLTLSIQPLSTNIRQSSTGNNTEDEVGAIESEGRKKKREK